MKDLFNEKKYPDCTNYFSDKNFNILAVETMLEGPNVHLLDDTKIEFKDNTIIITYDKKDALLALLILNIIIGDPFFNYTEYMIDGKKFTENDEFDLYNKYFDKIYKNNKIIIFAKDIEDFNYEKSILIYKTDSNHSETYYMATELHRWKTNNPK